MILNCIILGNDPEGFGELENCLATIPFIYVARRCHSLEEACFWLGTQTIHILLLGQPADEQFPPTHPRNVLPVIMMTYPGEGFDFLPAGILSEPFNLSELEDLINKIYHTIEMEGAITPSKYETGYFMVRTPHRFEKIYYDDLMYVEVMDDHIMLHLKEQQLVTAETLDWVISQLPASAFMRVHRWFVIGLRHISRLEESHVTVGTARISLTASMRKELTIRTKLPM